MIDGLDKLLEDRRQPCLAELRELLDNSEMSRDTGWCLQSQEPLQPPGQRVFRLRFARDGQIRSLVVKRLEPAMARRSELVARRWLPAIGLDRACPSLRGSATARDGSCTWHLYEDLGPWELDCQASDREPVRAAIALIARIHTRFASHALMGEVRLHGADYGIHFFQTNVQDALCALEAVRPPAERRELCARLLHRLGQLREQLPARAEALTDLGGPETLLHGDLWTINLFVSRNDGALEARLIDWDRAGVGPISYDLSTFLLRFSQPHRAWVLRLYEQAVAQEGWQLPGQQDLNLLFETAELARYANRVIWPAIAWVRDRAAWGFDQLAEVEEWFENLRPVLASATAASTVGPVA